MRTFREVKQLRNAYTEVLLRQERSALHARQFYAELLRMVTLLLEGMIAIFCDYCGQMRIVGIVADDCSLQPLIVVGAWP